MNSTLQRAWQLYRFRRYPLALEETMKFLSHHPESPEAHCLLALIHGQEKRQQNAIKAAEDAIRYSPDSSYAHYVHALVAYWFDEHELALKSLSEAMRLSPDNPDFYELLAGIYYERRQLKTALHTAKLGLAQNAVHVGCLFRCAVALFELNKKRLAEKIFRVILAIDAEHIPSLGFIGHFEVEYGHCKQALPLLRHALRADPTWPLAQAAWKEALRGSFLLYGAVARLRQLLFVSYRWLTYVMVFLLSGYWLYSNRTAGSGGAVDAWGMSAILGACLTVCLVPLLHLVVTFYLGAISRIILFFDPELRRTLSWRILMPESRLVRYFLFWIMIMVLSVLCVFAMNWLDLSNWSRH